MTPTNTDAAREAADFEAWMASSNYPEIADIALERLPDGTYKSQLTFAAWQAWQGARHYLLAKALEGADEKIAEIRKYAGLRKGISEFEILGRHSKVVEDHRNYLLTLVTALSADRDRQAAGWKEAIGVAIRHLAKIDHLHSELTAQKAAHAKMLRDEAQKIKNGGALGAVVSYIRRLADKIEGESCV